MSIAFPISRKVNYDFMGRCVLIISIDPVDIEVMYRELPSNYNLLDSWCPYVCSIPVITEQLAILTNSEIVI